MNDVTIAPGPTRERLLGALYEAAELEHNLMCTYLYAAFRLGTGEKEGLSKDEAGAVARWRQTIVDVAIDEMGHLAAVREITSGTGRVVARVLQAKLCRCGGSNTKPFCDGTHARIGFKAD